MPMQANAEFCVCVESISMELEISAIYPAPTKDESEWVELTNLGDINIDLSFYTLEDETAKPMQLSGTIQSGSSTKINELSFQLNNGGDTVTLKTNEGETVDSFNFSSSKSGEAIYKNSAGKEPPKSEESTQKETSIANNTPEKWPIFSEALPNPEGMDSTEEWIELYNPYAENLNLDGLKIDDSEGGSSAYSLSGNMSAKTYLIISIEDSKISLNNSVDSVRLLGVNGEVLWEVTYENPKEGESYALINGSYEWTNSLTPNGPNLASTGGETESEYENGDLSEELELTEVYPDPEGPDQEDEWIEITNGGTETVNMGNWIIDDGEGGSKPYVFPDDTFIEPGETIVIYRSESKVALNNSNETVQLKDYTGEIVSEISYEKAVEGESYSKIEIEEMENMQASTSGLGARIFNTWQWVAPSPGVSNPKWQQFTGEVLNFDGSTLSIFDGISNWEFLVTEGMTNNLVFQTGNIILVQAAIKDGVYNLMNSELIEAVSAKARKDFPWGALASGLLAVMWLGYEIHKKRQSKLITI